MSTIEAYEEAVMSATVRTWPNRPGVVVEAMRPEARAALADLTSDVTLKYRTAWPPPLGRRGRFNRKEAK